MKKKIFMITLAACLIVLSVASSSFAYFTDTDSKTNVFTAGKVDIELIYDNTDTRLYPGQTYTKVATIKNVGNEDAFVGIIIDIPKAFGYTLDEVKKTFTVDDADVVEYIEGSASASNGASVPVYRIFAVVNNAVIPGNNVTLNISTNVGEDWGNTEMKTFDGLSISVTAYATQRVGFDNATVALTKSFPGPYMWGSYPTTSGQ